MLAVFQQLVGINVIFYYGATLWQLAGFTEDQSLLINIVSGAVSIAACFVTIAVIDKIGRKPLLLIGSAGMAVTLFVMVYAFSQRHRSIRRASSSCRPNLGMIAVVAANLYVIFFNVSWGPVMWVMLGEMFPNQIRGSALAVAGFVQWFANFLISFSFPVMAAKLGLTVSYTFYGVSRGDQLLPGAEAGPRDQAAWSWRKCRDSPLPGTGALRRLRPGITGER